MSDLLKLPVLFIKPVFKVDRSVKLEFETREISGLEIAVLMEYRQKEGYLVFAPNKDIKESDIPDEKADSMTGQKTQAQRLRGSIYRVWESRGKKGEFEDFYRSQMEYVIELYKEKIE